MRSEFTQRLEYHFVMIIFYNELCTFSVQSILREEIKRLQNLKVFGFKIFTIDR